ncbi:uncharacterized protein LOC135333916 isoform X2 [Halichondria panicea]|uniref:uncharacterized protein LOC135333916 isoform X2 n=1 Tax=Halichondria panicea TaxID=6063 RepID=UPI00312B846D
MGCGTSKATQVANTDITIKEDSSMREPQPLTQGEATTRATVSEERTDDHGTASQELTTQHSCDSQAGGSNDEERPKFEAFEVSVNEDGSSDPKGLPPRRLSKLDSVPKLTTEMLAEKQRQVEERKQQELEKRANKRVSRKDRLRKQIVEARDMESASSDSNGRVKALKLSASEGLDTESGTASYDPSVEMDVDLTYNTDEQNGFWESQNSETNLDNNDKAQSDTRNNPVDDFGSNKSEQYL